METKEDIRSVIDNLLSLSMESESFENVFNKLFEGFIQAISMITEVKDPYTAAHQRRVASLAVSIAQEMDLPEQKIEGIRLAASIHDVGKIYVPSEILSKPGKISEAELSIIRNHPQIGYDILKNIEFLWPIAKIVLQHHERIDGSGYPAGLFGDEILLEVKVISVADVVEAISSHRPYRPALGTESALVEISKNKGILYDPDVVDACLTVLNGSLDLAVIVSCSGGAFWSCP